MLVRSLSNVETVDVGFDRDHIVMVDVDVNARGYSGARLTALAHTLYDRLAAIPGVHAVAFSENGIFSGSENGTTLQVPGSVPRVPADTEIAYDFVSAGYAAAIGAHGAREPVSGVILLSA